MIDIETLGTQTTSVIISVAAIEFSLEPFSVGKAFYSVMDTTQFSSAFTTDQATIEWWTQQNEEARAVFREEKGSPLEVLSAFSRFLEGGERFWCQGTSFDFPILEHAFRHYNIRVPWKFYQQRDTRTVFDIMNFNLKTLPFETAGRHNALVDCKRQLIGLTYCIGNKVDN